MKAPVSIFLMRMPQVEEAVGLKKSKIHDLIREGKFPAPVALTRTARAYRSDQIQDWILARRPPIEEESAQQEPNDAL